MNLKETGFTLIETLMVMVILGTVLLAAAGLANTVLTSAAKNQNRVIATYLAQECTELTRNVRDNAWRQNLPWMCPFVLPGETEPLIYDETTNPQVLGTATESGVSPLCTTDSGVSLSLKPFATKDDTNLYRNLGRLDYDPVGEVSIFKRYVTLDAYTFDPSNDSGDIELTCHVEWDDGGVHMTQRLTNWRQP